MSADDKRVSKHVGFKSLIMMIGLLLATVYTMLEFFMTWLPAEIITAAMITKVAVVWIILLVVLPVIAYIAHMIWKVVHAAEEKYLAT